MEILKNLDQMVERLEKIKSYLYMNDDVLSSVLKIPVIIENFKKKSQIMIYSMELNHLIQIYKYIEEHKNFLMDYTFNNGFMIIDETGTELENVYPEKQSYVYQNFLKYKENFETWHFSILN
jgi:hypothetical protein